MAVPSAVLETYVQVMLSEGVNWTRLLSFFASQVLHVYTSMLIWVVPVARGVYHPLTWGYTGFPDIWTMTATSRADDGPETAGAKAVRAHLTASLLFCIHYTHAYSTCALARGFRIDTNHGCFRLDSSTRPHEVRRYESMICDRSPKGPL